MQRRTEGIKINYNYGLSKSKIFLIGLYIFLIFPVLFDTLKGFTNKPDFAWFFHPIACFGELSIYSWYSLKYKFHKNPKLTSLEIYFVSLIPFGLSHLAVLHVLYQIVFPTFLFLMDLLFLSKL